MIARYISCAHYLTSRLLTGSLQFSPSSLRRHTLVAAYNSSLRRPQCAGQHSVLVLPPVIFYFFIPIFCGVFPVGCPNSTHHKLFTKKKCISIRAKKKRYQASHWCRFSWPSVPLRSRCTTARSQGHKYKNESMPIDKALTNSFHMRYRLPS